MISNMIRTALAAALLGAGSGANAQVTIYTDRAAFEASAGGPLTLVNFDTDASGNPIAADSPGVLAGNLYAGFGVSFAAGVVFGEPNLPFIGVTPPNIISNSGINTPTPALVNATFSTPVARVGITDVGAEAVLRLYDTSNALIASVVTDTDPATFDFVGVASDTPIRRIEYDFVSGIGFGGDDLIYTPVPELPPVLLLAAGLPFLALRRGRSKRRGG